MALVARGWKVVRVGKFLFAWVYHHLLSNRGRPSLDDPFTRDVRAPLIARAQGEVLEIGAGDGGNLMLYPSGVRLTLLEPNPYLIRYLRQACNGRSADCVAVVEGIGECLPFPARSFDTVVATHVLCSVRDQGQVLAEVRRVLRPGGQFLFLEHVAAPPDSHIYRWQQVVNPVWKVIGDGCHLTRDTGAAIRAAGFAEVHLVTFNAGFPALVSPHVVGAARV